MLCVKCGQELVQGAAFCPFCGEKVAQGEPGSEEPVYQTEVKGLLHSGKLAVYRDRAEFVTSSVQKATYSYSGLVSVKKGWDSIDFITEDGRTESCPVGRKKIHEAFLYIEQAARPYLAQREERLRSQGVRYSFPSSQGLLNDGVLSISSERAEFRAKSGSGEIIPFEEVKSVSASGGTLEFSLFGGKVKSFAVGKEQRDEVLAFVAQSIAPYLARRKEALLAQGIYFSFQSADGRTVNVLADGVQCRDRSGQEEAVSFQSVRAVNVYGGVLELALTDGTSRSFPVEDDAGGEVLSFVRNAIEPYVQARTAGFDTAFGLDERMEVNGERGVFHIIRQSGREITGEWPVDALTRCEWTERTELSALGSVVSGGIALFKTAAKAAGNQNAAEAEERLSCAGVVLTLRTEQGEETQSVWFGLFPAGMSRTNKKYDQYLAEWTRCSEYLRLRCPECELIEPVLPEPEPQPPEEETGTDEREADPVRGGEPSPRREESADAAPRDELGIARYIEGVSRFIEDCKLSETPMTIAFQGNRGSGGNSTLNMLFKRLKEWGGSDLLWLSARQFPQGESGEALSVLVGKKLIGLLTGEASEETKAQAGTLLTGLAGVVTGVFAGDSSIGKELAGGLLNRDSVVSPEQLAELFAKKLETRNKKVVIFVDGMDRLSPGRTVELLEVMRDFFDCKGCVAVIAVDYSAVLSGARERYGQEFDGKRCFDGLFKMSFRVPASSYNVEHYVRSKLEHIGIQTGDEELALYVSLIQASVGRDPESMDRLFASFQLLKNTADEAMYENRYQRLALFALLCMQKSFGGIYDCVVERKDSLTPGFLMDLCGTSPQSWGGDQISEEEKAAFRDFGGVFARIINLDAEEEISEAECRAFAEVLEFSSITSQ